jgi:hypothetical protein
MSFLNQLFSDVVRALESKADISGPPKVVSNDIVNGDVNILQLAIFTPEKFFDLKSQVTEIHIYESIVSPVIYCNMTFADAINLQEGFKIQENAIVRFEFQTPGTSQSNEYFFRVNRIHGKKDVPGLTMKVYDVELISVEASVAQDIPMEGFSREETSGVLIERIIKEKINTNELIGQINKERRAQRIEIDSTRGIIAKNKMQLKVLAKNRRPFEAIHELALLTNKSPEGYSLYTFFERKDGYQFKSIEKLISDGKLTLTASPELSDRIFFYDHQRNQDYSAVKFRNILAYNILSTENIAGSKAGGVKSEVVGIDPVGGENTNPVTATIDKNVTDLTSVKALRSFDAVTRSENITSTEYTHLPELLAKRRQLLLRIIQNEAQILIYGDSDLTVGNVIECNFPRSTSTGRESSDPKGSSELSDDSGFYLITHLRHMILNTDRPQHIISCNLMRAEGDKD